MSKCLVLFVEGDTEVEFYKRVISNARQKRADGRFDINIECKNVKGVGGFKNIALRKFIKEIKPKYGEECEFNVALCRDTDVFELSPKPPINWSEVEAAFKENGVRNVIHIRAERSIEDWFLLDVDGIISFLRLSKKTKVSGGNGYDKLKKLFKQANKMYYKGMKSNGMVERLDIDRIVQGVHTQLESLYKVLGIY
ncbi:MAG: DUF4276 family protein [Lachnospiraceae bacterium]|jgi:hypothetical protein|nr:hypothetical protein [uncultured Schaedlerella sp.]MCI8985613.1 DUF4276 family protein [Lachnospiraceae bacterium]